MARRKVKYTICPNCDYSFRDADNYCPNCGQKNHTHKQPIHHFLFELIEGYLHFDSKAVNTFKDMFRKPGLITRNYNQGKRAKYVSPIKFYIFVSFIFFLILSLNKGGDQSGSSEKQSSINTNFTVQPIDKVVKPKDLVKLANYPKLDNAFIIHYLDSLGLKTRWYYRSFCCNYIKLKTGHITSEDYRHQTLKTFSTAMFFLMPLVAFYFLLFHIKSKMYYAEHLVMSLHLHSFAFLILSIRLLLKPFLSSNWFYFVILPGILLYLVISIKTVYQQKVGIVIIKSFFLSLIYLFTFVVFFLVVLAFSLF